MCAASDALRRLGRVLRHLSVGLVDQAIPLRLLSSDLQIESFALGPIQTIMHPELRWPLRNRRFQHVVDALSASPPNILHALSAESFELAGMLADQFDAELVYHVTSIADCVALEEGGARPAGRLIAASRPLLDRLSLGRGYGAEQIELIRPGVLAAERTACFARPERVPTMVCTSPLAPGSGVDQLIASLDIVRRRGHEIMVFLLGRGRHDEPLRRAVRRLGLTSIVTFANPMGDLSTALRSADLYVLPAEATAFSAGSLQAMAEGVLVVTLPNAVADHYRDGETSLVCPGGEAGDLAEAILRAVGDTAFARNVARGGQEHVRRNHSVSAMAERTAAVYRGLVLSGATIPLRE